MDTLTQIRLMVFGAWVLFAVLALGSALVASLLLGARDARQVRLRTLVLERLASLGLGGAVDVKVRSSLFGARGVVVVNLAGYPRAAVWHAAQELSRALPPRVRLQLEGLEPRLRVAVRTKDLDGRPSRPLAA